ncbi:LysR family transcriptional regulator [Frigidibacter sp. ROC022]|uniref:LysR family transcriptional regulator n=1 Tax=Frigidibacter sp. ROC022 TaxID=2971796 RepID=UPI00215A7906|nr:LysR family transcriptional regulator [Frigidibacter sp. ROC022]MCR8724721.1 LysR family transcriptional regulator [Frigidibacter sp. ROC022]
MIEDYRGLAIFVAIADAGSLSAAGRRLKLSTSVVSHHLSRLEAKLGVTLFFRSTRSMSLTPEGRAALGPARRMVAAGEEALDAVGAGSDEPVGALRVAMPAWGENMRIIQALWEFARRHPMVAISLHSSDRPADLIRDGFDLAIRLGTLADSSLKSRRIGDFSRLLVAAPDYLAGRPPVRTLEDLAGCDFIAVSMIPDAMTLHCEGETAVIQPENVRLEVDTIVAAKSAVLAGLGVRVLPLGEIEAELASGRLVEVLPQWRLSELGIYAVWPDSGPQKALTRRLIEVLADKSMGRAP